MSVEKCAGGPIWSFPDTWEIRSEKGYWERTAAPLLESEYKGFGSKLATQRYINPNGTKTTRTGAEPGEMLNEEITQDVAKVTSGPARQYPTGKCLTKGEATKARFRPPHDGQGKSICWDFNSHAGGFRGPTSMNSHVRMKPGPIHWCLQDGLIRRGRNRRSGKLIPPQEIDGAIGQLREKNRLDGEAKRVSGKGNFSSTVEQGVSTVAKGNPVLPNAPGDTGISISPSRSQ